MTSTELAAGSTFAGYRIEAEIGRGGMGVVYRAVELSLERAVALKLIAPELASDEGFRKRFLKESRLAASLDHPHVLPVFQAGEAEGQLYIAMRYVQGQDLRTLLRREGTLDAGRAIPICGQVAEALDAAHRRGLVHRDLKPGNVLLDSSGEAYLADFGLTKQAGDASTQTGELVGTLDYLAPEQIRGEEVDGRTDQYALACVLYECLTGSAPFHRSTEAELLWAHMQEEPPPIDSHPELDPVFARALAKEKQERYPDCAALVEAAAGALGLETPRLRRRRRLMRRSRLLIAAGALVLAAAAATAVVEVTTRSSAPTPIGNSVAAIGGEKGKVTSYTATGTTPSNVVLGGGSVWVLNADDRTISRIDPNTKQIVKTFATGGLPTDLAYGGGSLWVGNGRLDKLGLGGDLYTSSVSRIDPGTYHVTGSVRLPLKPGIPPSGSISGISALAAYGGNVWAIDPDSSLSRIDAATNRITMTVPISGTSAIAAGREGVWVTRNGPSVTHIDPRTGRVGQTITAPTSGFTGIALGDGAVWTTNPDEGTVWRIDPGPQPTSRTIEVGFGTTFVSFAHGSLWTANFIQGTVTKIDPRTNTVVSTTPMPGTPQGVAAGADVAWATTAGGLRSGSLPASACGPVQTGGRKADLLIASDLPLQGGSREVTSAMANAVRFVLRRHHYRAGAYAVGYQSCDDSTAQSGQADYFRCASNAKAYSQAAQLVALIGTYNSYCASVELPIVNRAQGGSLPMISPANTDPALTREAPGNARGLPQANYPTGVRNYLRLVPPDDLQGAADAVFAKKLGLRKVFVLQDGDVLAAATGFARATHAIGFQVAGSATWSGSTDFPALAQRVARSGADGVFVAATPFSGVEKAIRALRARLGSGFPIIGTDALMPLSTLSRLVGPDARGMYLSFPGLGALSPAGRRLWRAFQATQPGGTLPEGTYVPQTVQATELVLQAIARSDGTRASVLQELRALHGRDGLLGPFRFDDNGDVSPEHVTVFRVTGRTPKSENLVSDFQGAVPVQVVSIPSDLIGSGTSR